MHATAQAAVGAGARTGSPCPGAGACRPWTAEELLWLRVVKSPDDRLRPCDWAFLDERLGRPRAEVRRMFVDLGLVRCGRRHRVDEGFFDAWTPPMAWVLGLLLSDGHFAKGAPTIQFSSTDLDLVERVRACLGATHPVRACVGGTGHLGDKPVHILAINRKRLRRGVDALLPARLKADRRELPTVPDRLLRHLARGYFEGDGSIFFDGRRGNLHVQVSGATPFIEDLRRHLEAAGLDVPPGLY
ncbi:MAG: hypothetical protein KC583_08180, partial [Myxococcales bacterium]|nr:hypothetical protein [Myxococcales bacterium]